MPVSIVAAVDQAVAQPGNLLRVHCSISSSTDIVPYRPIHSGPLGSIERGRARSTGLHPTGGSLSSQISATIHGKSVPLGLHQRSSR
jgi:hypothetical protein